MDCSQGAEIARETMTYDEIGMRPRIKILEDWFAQQRTVGLGITEEKEDR